MTFCHFCVCVYRFMNSNTYIQSCSYSHNQDTEQFFHSEEHRFWLHSPFTSNTRQPTDLVLHHYSFVFLKMSYKLNHTVYNFWRLAFFTQHNNFDIHVSLCTEFCVNLSFYLLRLNTHGWDY